MCHGESQEKGQEESQEEIVLALVITGEWESLSLAVKFEDDARASGHRRFWGPLRLECVT
jgi:hypothetical protein